MSAWPTEEHATLAVDAAARAAYEKACEAANRASPRREPVQHPSYDELGPIDKRDCREAVLPYVWEALNALPDPRHAAWWEGYEAVDPNNPYPPEV